MMCRPLLRANKTAPSHLLFNSILFLALCLILNPPVPLRRHSSSVEAAGLNEHERVAEYHKRNYTWPPLDEEYIPNTEGWRRIMKRRLEQVQRIENGRDMYNGWVATIHTGLIAPNFTEYGWAVTRAPQGLLDELVSSLHRGLSVDLIAEEGVGTTCIDSPDPPLYHPIESLERRALLELCPIVEAWVNHDKREKRVHLIGNNAYGLRIYRNQSRLNMHVDKSGTHVISAILHVDHDENSKPWPFVYNIICIPLTKPIVIEDYYGNLNEVVLEKGDILLYESSKCFHGRPRRFEGDWYTSLFIHYYPSDWRRTYDNLEVHYRIPPKWNEVLPPKPGLETLVMAETSAYEPDCEDTWCTLNNTIQWDERGEFGKVLSGDGVVSDLDFDAKEIRKPRHWTQHDEL
ncbi:hypothetical protein ACHAXR_013368 [Thalassiosira sp. AJA248-18]